ncbi:hypothetical protein, partial [Nostoc sp. UHCC 0252]|uniref:hypothetical protein n=1 Tax=Nostoc sp. UHCC 0252 TaxID=3110241 RepID=UPI002B203C8D
GFLLTFNTFVNTAMRNFIISHIPHFKMKFGMWDIKNGSTISLMPNGVQVPLKELFGSLSLGLMSIKEVSRTTKPRYKPLLIPNL